jgi:triosephosphate isomerase (TIM)
MDKIILAANWKMQGNRKLASDMAKMLEQCKQARANLDIRIFPPNLLLSSIQEHFKHSPIQWGAQNICHHEIGAFTGEIAASMLPEFGCSTVLIGHSERRQHFKEGNSTLKQKLHYALQAKLSPIFCIGESATEQQQGKTLACLKAQLRPWLTAFQNNTPSKDILLAYEPIWAIGSGKTAQATEVQEIHAWLKSFIKDFNPTLAKRCRILYGGSVKPANIKELISQNDIDGVLIGGASLDPNTFKEMIEICYNCYSFSTS